MSHNWTVMLLILLSLLQPAPDPRLRAVWDGPVAVISWTQPSGIGQTCLYRYYGAQWPAAVCWHDLRAGPMRIKLPGTLTHPAYTPADGDRFVLEFNGSTVASATLGEVRVYRAYLPLIDKRAAPRHVVRLAAIRG